MGMKPIIFSTDMIKAILDGRKNITRRVIKPQPDEAGILPATSARGELVGINVRDKGLAPYRPGDILWVRETWRNGDCCDFLQHCPDEKLPGINCDIWKQDYMYKADDFPCSDGCKWKPSIHMPRAAARIFLRVTDVRVTDVRVERVQDISEIEVMKEGCKSFNDGNCFVMDGTAYDKCGLAHSTPTMAYAVFWDELYVKRGYGWDVNPWVWVYEFERVVK